jgi:ATP-binding cassette subfamily C (CFTR/MRP) protein 4
MLILFLCAEAVNTAFFRLFGYYDLIVSETMGGWQFSNYWLALGLLQLGYFIFLASKYFVLNYVVLKSNEKLHMDMLFGLLRSPTKLFDTTPTGRLINRFSNDMSILDSTLAITLTDTIEGPILAIVLLVNVFQIVPWFIVPSVVNLLLLGFWFYYCKRTIVQTKQLDLRMKSPVFSEFTQLVSGATQVKIYGQTSRMNTKMSNTVNDSIRVNHSFWFASRVFGSWTSYASVLICGVGFFVGVSQISNGGLYGISIVFLLQMSDYLQWFLRQIINMESIMVSVEREFAITNLQPEAPLRTDYDKSIGFKD